ncbi:MAG: class I SAM-dependent methyltransferase [Vicinamibacterales bacterium]
MLEVGCSIGTDCGALRARGALVTGVDGLCQTAIDMASKGFELRDLAPVELQVANAEALPFGDATFDHVYGHGVIR